MENLPFVKKHNVVAFLDVNHERAGEGFIEVFEFLINSRLNYAISTDPLIYHDMIDDFWGNVRFEERNGVPALISEIQGTELIVTEEVIRRVLELHDENGIVEIPVDEVQHICREAGYEGDFPGQMVKKTRFSFNWRYIVHVLIMCFSSRQGGLDEMSHRLASGFACLVTQRIFNFSEFIFDNMKRMLEESKKKFMLYPRFIQMIIDSELFGRVMPEGEVLYQQNMNWKIMGNMKKNFAATGFSGVFTPFFPYMLNPEVPIPNPVDQPQSPPHVPSQPPQSPHIQDQVDEVIPEEANAEVPNVVETVTIIPDQAAPIEPPTILKVYQSRRKEKATVGSSVGVYDMMKLEEENQRLKSRIDFQNNEILKLKMQSVSHLMLISALKGKMVNEGKEEEVNNVVINEEEEEINVVVNEEEEEEINVVVNEEEEERMIVNEEEEEEVNVELNEEFVDEVIADVIKSVEVEMGEGSSKGKEKIIEINSEEEEEYPAVLKTAEAESDEYNIGRWVHEFGGDELPQDVLETGEEENPFIVDDSEVEGVEVNVKVEADTEQKIPQTSSRLKSVAKKSVKAPSAVVSIKQQLELWRRSMDLQNYRKHLKNFLIRANKFSARSVGQMKTESLENHYLEFKTKERLEEMKKNEGVESAVERERREKEAQMEMIQERRRKEEEERLKEQTVSAAEKVTLESLVAKQPADVDFQRELKEKEFIVNEEGQRHIDELQDWFDSTDEQGNTLDKYGFPIDENVNQPGDEVGSESRIKDYTLEQLRAEKIELERIQKGISAPITGWRFDPSKNAIVVKRGTNRCTYYYSTADLLKMSKEDARQLSQIRMVNHGMYPHGRQIADFINECAKSDFKDFDKKLSKKLYRKRKTMMIDVSPIPRAKKQKLPRVIGWWMDCECDEIVVEREDGSSDRLYEDADLRSLSNDDLLALGQLPFRNYDQHPEGEHFIKVVQFQVALIRDNVR